MEMLDAWEQKSANKNPVQKLHVLPPDVLKFVSTLVFLNNVNTAFWHRRLKTTLRIWDAYKIAGWCISSACRLAMCFALQIAALQNALCQIAAAIP